MRKREEVLDPGGVPDYAQAVMASHGSEVQNAPDSWFTLYHGDSRRLDELLGSFSSPDSPLLTTTVTSPPYGNLKDYGHEDQIGFGQPHDEYLVECKRILRAIHGHTRDDGSLWLIADTLRLRDDDRIRRLQPLPFQLAEQASDVGWILREVIVWHKDKTLPWSGRGRLRNTFEYILFFVKSDNFKYHVGRLRDPVQLEDWWVRYPERYNPEGKVPTNVWNIPIPVQGSWSNTTIQHACPLPPDLVERLILLSTDEGDVVFDPFAGSGVVVAEAERLGRRGLGVELVRKHVAAFHKVVRPEILERRGRDELLERYLISERLQDLILRLRTVKLARELMKQLSKTYPQLPQPRLAVVIRHEQTNSSDVGSKKLIDATYTFVIDADQDILDETQRALKDLTTRSPASKYGVAGDVIVVGLNDLSTHPFGEERLYLYRDGKTWWAETEVFVDELPGITLLGQGNKFPPIVSNVLARQKPGDPVGSEDLDMQKGRP